MDKNKSPHLQSLAPQTSEIRTQKSKEEAPEMRASLNTKQTLIHAPIHVSKIEQKHHSTYQEAAEPQTASKDDSVGPKLERFSSQGQEELL